MTDLPTEAEPVKVIQGDCLDVLSRLPAGCVDAVITDPPYGTGGWRREGSGQGSSPAARLIRESWDDGRLDWLHHAARVSPVVMTFWPSARASALLLAANAEGLIKHRAVYWHKPDPKPQVSGRVAWSVEPVWVLSRDGVQLYGETDWFSASTPRVRRDQEAVGHPYQKPLRVLRWLLRKLPDARLILDPFAGSGTTGVAAAIGGRRCLLIEKEPTYADIARRRVAEAMGTGLLAGCR